MFRSWMTGKADSAHSANPPVPLFRWVALRVASSLLAPMATTMKAALARSPAVVMERLGLRIGARAASDAKLGMPSDFGTFAIRCRKPQSNPISRKKPAPKHRPGRSLSETAKLAASIKSPRTLTTAGSARRQVWSGLRWVGNDSRKPSLSNSRAGRFAAPRMRNQTVRITMARLLTAPIARSSTEA